jgi:hypothetical protein
MHTLIKCFIYGRWCTEGRPPIAHPLVGLDSVYGGQASMASVGSTRAKGGGGGKQAGNIRRSTRAGSVYLGFGEEAAADC